MLNRPSPTGRTSAIAVRRLVRTLNHLPAAKAAEVLTGTPVDLAARALARTTPHHGMLIAGALGVHRVERLIEVLPENSRARRELRVWLLDGRRTGHFADDPEHLERLKSAEEELKEHMQQNPHEVIGWYRHE